MKLCRCAAFVSLALSGSVCRQAAAEPCAKAAPGERAVLARLGQVTLDGVNVASWLGVPVSVLRNARPITPSHCMDLLAGDIVETQRGATATIEFESSLALLQPFSRIRVEPPSAKHDIWSFFGEIFGFGRLKVQDRYVTAGAEGTLFRIRSTETGAIVQVFEGHVRVESQGSRQSQVLAAGEFVTSGTPAAALLDGVTDFFLERASGELSGYLADQAALTGYTAQQIAHLEPRAAHDWLSFSLEGRKPVDLPKEAGELTASVRWTHRWLRATRVLALDSGVSLGGAFGQYRSPMFNPVTGQEEDFDAATASLPFEGLFTELDGDLAFWPDRPLGFTTSLGMRVGWSHTRYVAHDADSLVWGPVVTTRGTWRLGEHYSFLFHLNLALQHSPVAACPNGCTEPADPWSPIWEGWIGFGLGLELAL